MNAEKTSDWWPFGDRISPGPFFLLTSLDVVPVDHEQLVDRQIGALTLWFRRTLAAGQPLGDQSLIGRAALGGVVAAEVMVLAAEGDDGLAGGFVAAVGGN